MTAPPPDGLDPAALAAALPSRRDREARALDLLAAHLDACPDGYAAWSGGRDSTAAVHLATRLRPRLPVCWFHSGLEYPETEEYVYRLAEDWQLNMHVIRAAPDALALLAGTGDWAHHTDHAGPVGALHEALIAGPARIAHAVHGSGEVLGLRAAESVARRRTLAGTGGTYQRADGTRVCAPLWNWGHQDVAGYLAAHRIPENPVYLKLRRLGVAEDRLRAGLAFDGNSLDFGAATWLRTGWPALWRQLVDALPRAAEWR